MSARRLAVCFGVALAACALGCGAVPDLVFESADATFDSASDASDETQVDAAVGDAGPSTCPNMVPSYATICCGPIACSGSNCVATCSDCAKCSPLDLCCPNAQNRAVCKPGQHC